MIYDLVALHTDITTRTMAMTFVREDQDIPTTTLRRLVIAATRLHERRAVAATLETASADTDPVVTTMLKNRMFHL
jgi:hypothetical protein